MWVQLQLVFYLLCNIAILHGELSADSDVISCGNHSYFSRQQCSCYSNSHVHCPGSFTATITADSVPTHMGIQCHSSDPLPSDVVPLENIKAVVLTDCAFGNHSLVGNAENLTDLSIYCRPGTNYNLSSILFNGLSNLKLLHIWCPGLNSVDADSFKFISKSITHLTIRGSLKLNQLHEKLFENMNQLVMIRIKDNPNLNKLPEYLLYGLKQLKSLYLDHNTIKRLHFRTFQSLDQLTDLSLIGNQLLILEPLLNETSKQTEPNLVLLGQVELAHALYHRSELSLNESNENSTRIKRQINNDVSLFQNLHSLNELRLDFNILPTLKSVNNLKKLRRLSLRNCSVSKISSDSLDGLVNLESLDLSLNTIHVIPHGFLQSSAHTLQSFVLTDNIASNLTLATGALSNLHALRELNLSRSGLRDIPFGTFNDLKSLKIIDISQNHLNELPRLVFQSSNDLEIIDLSHNILTNIPNDLLENLVYLKEFDISGNVLSRIPPNLFTDTKTLLKFNCHGNKLRTLGPYNLLGLARTHHLDFSNNAIATVDPEAFSNMAATQRGSRGLAVDLRNFTRSSPPRPMTPSRPLSIELKNLSLANNRLTQLPARIFATLTSLEILDLSNNSLTTLPGLSFLRELRELWLAGNRLRELPAPMFVDGSRLRSLSLRNNFVTELPPSLLLGVGSSLTNLDVSHNSLSEFSTPILSGLDSLEILDASHNKLRTVDFSALTTLREAELSHNALTFKEAGWVFYRTNSSPGARGASAIQGQWGRQGTFGNCSSLERLGLANNSLSDILLDLRRLPSLRRLDLAHNSISTLEARDLQYASSNLTIDVRHNHVAAVKLREDDLVPASAGRHDLGVRLLLENNPMACDCRLPNLLRYLFGDSRLRLPADMHGAEIIANELACYLPPSVRGKRLLEVETWGHYLLPLLGLCHVFQ